jgi:hypothetical protein
MQRALIALALLGYLLIVGLYLYVLASIDRSVLP